MIDGTYRVSALTPMGLKKGTVDFRTEVAAGNSSLSVRLNVSGFRIAISKATYKDNSFCLNGTLGYLLGRFPFACQGTVEGDTLHALATSGNMSIQLEGSRIENT